ncbi:Trm112 family protein [Ornithobacterium rhinotracheale]|uniref:Trm112 family protein n=1 Tax=Ornithobacterium rhinotracheale TaxID=28251 RepID=UPI00403A662D
MEKRIIDKMCCPFDHSDLKLTIFKMEGENVEEGLFICPECGRYFPIISGIPIMSPDEYREPDFERNFLIKWRDMLPKEIAHKVQLKLSNLE